MTDLDPDDANWLLLSDLTAERDRFIAELFQDAENSVAVDVQRDRITAQIQAAQRESTRIQALEASPEALRSPEVRRELRAALEMLAVQTERLIAAVTEIGELEDSELQSALALRARFLRLGLSQHHQEISVAQAADFDRRKADMEGIVEAVVRAANGAPAASSPPTPGERISSVVEAYRKSQVAEGTWTAKTEIEIMAGLHLWMRIVVDQPITRYDHEQHRKYKTTLQGLPANLNKLPKYRGLSIEEVVALGDQPAARNTISKQLARVSALFKWACNYGYTSQNPAAGMRLKNLTHASKERDAFNLEDLGKLFGGKEYREGSHLRPFMFWTPLLALYTGARQNEIAQLHLADFQIVDGMHVICINDDGEGKRVKTKASQRTVPIHAELIRLGILDYVATLGERGESRLFPELPKGRDGYGQKVSKWFARYRSRVGVTGNKKVFHSFRHTVVNQLKQANHPKEHIAALVGHEDGNVTFGRYGKAFEAATMKGIVDALHFESITSAIAPFKAPPSPKR